MKIEVKSTGGLNLMYEMCMTPNISKIATIYKLTEHPVPDNEHPSVVFIDAVSIGTMVDTVM